MEEVSSATTGWVEVAQDLDFASFHARHARLHQDAAALLRALDEHATAVAALSQLIHSVEDHLQTDIMIGYRLFLRHPSESVRRIADHVLHEHEAFPGSFEAFRERWRGASEERLRASEFREELETLVIELLKRIRAEERLLAMLSNVA